MHNIQYTQRNKEAVLSSYRKKKEPSLLMGTITMYGKMLLKRSLLIYKNLRKNIANKSDNGKSVVISDYKNLKN